MTGVKVIPVSKEYRENWPKIFEKPSQTGELTDASLEYRRVIEPYGAVMIPFSPFPLGISVM